MKIAMVYLNNPPFGPTDHETIGIGGSENGFLNTAKTLVKFGHTVHFFNMVNEPMTMYSEKFLWGNIGYFDPRERYDVVISLRHKEFFDRAMNTALKVLFLADTESVGLGEYVRNGKIDVVMSVSNWQAEKIAREEGITGQFWIITSNGVRNDLPVTKDKVKNRFIFASTPERGLETLLDVWPRILEKVPDATLHLYSSFLGWRHTDEEDKRMMAGVYSRIEGMQGVTNRRHASEAELRLALSEAEFYLYPADFYETCCMCVLECMLVGVIPVVTGRAGLLEKVVDGVTGFTVPAYGQDTSRYKDAFVSAVVNATELSQYDKALIVGNEMMFARHFTYDVLIPKWVKEWERRIHDKA